MTSGIDSKALTTSAGRWFRAGLAAYVADPPELDFAVHHFGVAIEHLLKAYLSSIHPCLIMEGRDFDSLLHAVDQGAHANTPITGIKTIGLQPAYDRCKQLLKSRLAIDSKTFKSICDGRNGVAHSGIHAPANALAILEACAAVAAVAVRPLPSLSSRRQPSWWSLIGSQSMAVGSARAVGV